MAPGRMPGGAESHLWSSRLVLLVSVMSCSCGLGSTGSGTDVGLASITIHGDSPVGGIEWSPNFTTSQLHYNITMPKWTKKVTVTPVSSSMPPGKITVQTIVCATAHIAAAAPTCLARLSSVLLDSSDVHLPSRLPVSGSLS